MSRLRVFEAFSGIGAQKMALRNKNINHEVVGIAEIDADAIISYGSIHCNNINHSIMKNISDLEINKYITNKNIKSNGKIPKNEKKNRLVYMCSKSTNNYGDISLINPYDIPDHDLFTYSFPCQDISTFGKQMSLNENSGTRSSLLWECKKIIDVKKPKYLLLENVKNLVGPKHKKNFDLWLEWLTSNGYKNYWSILDGKDFGIPQRRPRVFVVSILGDEKFEMPTRGNELKPIEFFLEDIKEYEYNHSIIDDKIQLRNIEVNLSMNEGEIKFLDDRDWNFNGVIIDDLCSTQRAGRSGLKCIKREGDIAKVRNLTPLECWRLMGFKDEDYYRVVKNGASKTSILKQCGNSIIVDVLEEIFEKLFIEYIRR